MIIIIIIIFDLAVVSAHILALKLMINVKRKNIQGSQRFLLMALCIAELAYALVDIASQSCKMMRLPRLSQQAIWLFNTTCITFLYIIIMTLIKVDRFLEIYLNIKYNIVWSPLKTTIVLFVAATLCFLSSVPLFLVGIKFGNHRVVATTIFCYIYPILHFIFIAAFACTYFYIFKKLYKFRTNTARLQKQLHTNDTGKIHKKPNNRFKIFVPTLIIVTFLLFMVVPNVVRLCAFFEYVKPGIAYIVSFTSIPIGFLLDPCIYIFNLKGVRSAIRKRFCLRNTVHGRDNLHTQSMVEQKQSFLNRTMSKHDTYSEE